MDETIDVTFDIGGHSFNFFKAFVIVDLERARWNNTDKEYVMIVLFPKGKSAGTYPLKIFLGMDEQKAMKSRDDFYQWWKKALRYYAENKEMTK